MTVVSLLRVFCQVSDTDTFFPTTLSSSFVRFAISSNRVLNIEGIAGNFGTPMWIFYSNKGQAVSSFGVRTKDHPILEFGTANKAYESTSLDGFRTFLKVNIENA